MSAEHNYPGIQNDEFIFTSNCANGCGAWMGGSRSGAPSRRSYMAHGIPEWKAEEMENRLDGAFRECPNVKGYDPLRDMYPQDHRPVFNQNEIKRAHEVLRIETMKGAGI